MSNHEPDLKAVIAGKSVLFCGNATKLRKELSESTVLIL
jgi:hypothetical protein